MKKVLLLASLLVIPGLASAEHSIMFEIGVNLGANPGTEYLYGLRMRGTNVEANVSTFGQTWAGGLGYIVSTRPANSDQTLYATWTPGISYVSDLDNIVLVNRLAVGATGNVQGEIAYTHYGNFDDKYSKDFMSMAFGVRDVEKPAASTPASDSGATAGGANNPQQGTNSTSNGDTLPPSKKGGSKCEAINDGEQCVNASDIGLAKGGQHANWIFDGDNDDPTPIPK